jgi:very-short-patch-repair endonuclease
MGDLKTNPTIRGTTAEVRANAKALRWNLTLAERVLWEALKERRLDGLRFRCQHPVGPFVLDFWCPARKLAVEVTSGVYDRSDQAEYDEARTAQLELFGYRVVRVRNEEVLTDLASVLARIVEAAGMGDDGGRGRGKVETSVRSAPRPPNPGGRSTTRASARR